MKKYKYILIAVLFICFGVSSCEKWLDIQPKTEIKQNKLFESESGFKDALMGVYVLMGDDALYGKELSVTFLEVLAQQYELLAQNNYNSVRQYNYSAVTRFDNIWNKTYSILANVNAILDEIDKKKDIFHPTNYAIIKGEALGIRAYLHFDLLRMFGWGGIKERPDVLDKLILPYVTKYNKALTKQSTVREVLDYIKIDLAESELLLGSYDPISKLNNRPEGYELPNSDKFYDKRTSRFNYWTTIGLFARVYMWEANYDKAYQYASQFINPTKKPFNWVNPNSTIFVDIKSKDLKLLSENVFTLTGFKLYESIKTYVEKYTIINGFNMSENFNYFFFSDINIQELYEVSQNIGRSDWRYLEYFDRENPASMTYRKYYESLETSSVIMNKIPMMRISEMFYYAAECALQKGDRLQAIDIINQVRVNRGIEYDKNLPNNLNDEEIMAEIVKEWRKEFIGEGVMFYFYKRLNMAIPKAEKPSNDEIFVFPIPQNEIEIGGREDNINREK